MNVFYIYLQLFSIDLYLYWSRILLGIVSLLPEELFLTFSSNMSLLVTNSFSFCLKNFYLFIFERCIHFSGYRILDISVVFVPHFEAVSLLSSGLCAFWGVCCLSHLCPLVCMYFFSPIGCFKDFLLLEWEWWSSSFLHCRQMETLITNITAIKIWNSTSYIISGILNWVKDAIMFIIR